MATTKRKFDYTLPAGELLAHRLDGSFDFCECSSQPGFLRSSRILDSKQLSDEQGTRIRTLLVSKGSYGGEGARCFIPGFGFTIGSGADAMEILICLQCHWIYFFRGETQMVEALSDRGRRLLTEVYAELFPGNDPNRA
jgi:hypothetical protein